MPEPGSDGYDAEADLRDLRAALDLEGDEGPLDSRLLLWFLRKVMQVDDSDEYELVFESAGRQLDGFWLEASPEDTKPTLHLFEVKVGQTPETWGLDLVRQSAATVAALDATGLVAVVERDVRIAAQKQGLTGPPLSANYALRPTLILGRRLSDEAQLAAAEAGLRVYDLPWLARLARALRGPGLLEVPLRVPCPADKRFKSTTASGYIVVGEVRAADLAQWDGIEDRTLFGLNVRGELRQNRVRTGLDKAMATPSEHDDFIAFHNGLTVLCHEVDDSDPAVLRVRDVSVVNGAQSLLAFKRNERALDGTSLRVIVKFVTYTEDRAAFATEVARRSNTQTAVNPRNLRANEPRQAALAEEFNAYGGVTYLTKPDATHRPTGEAIQNDDAAQWLCALYLGRPWLAVKRTELFRTPNYERIFSREVGAAHILLAKRVYDASQRCKPSMPKPYQHAWRLTTVMAVYLAGVVMHNDTSLAGWLEQPATAVGREDLPGALDEVMARVAEILHLHHAQQEDFGYDDFKVDFKREDTARNLAELVPSVADPS